MRTRRHALLATCLAFFALSASALDVVYVVRHAQKNPSLPWSSMGVFRPLSPKGARCAAQLGKMMDNRGIAAVYSSETTRTLATGAAVSSTRDGVQVIGDDRSLKPTPQWVEELRAKHAGDQAILIVGHSNTVDDLALAFRPDLEECLERAYLSDSTSASAGIPETRYGDVWRLKLDEGLAACAGVSRERIPNTDKQDCSTP